MGKKDRKAEDILRDALKIKDVMHRKIVEKEIKIGRRLTPDEKQKVKNGIKTKYRIAQAVGLGLIVLGLGTGISNALPKGNDVPEERTVAENSAEREDFIKELQIQPDTDTLVLIDLDKEQKEIRNYIENEINNLKTEDEVLDYLKTFYINEYNLTKGTQYTEEQVKIMRYHEFEPEWIITADIIDNDKKISNSAYKDYWGCHSCNFSYYGKITDKEEDFMEDLAPVLDAGISRMASMNNKITVYSVKKDYKEDFINKMSDYVTKYKGKTYQIIKKNLEEKSNDDKEIGD